MLLTMESKTAAHHKLETLIQKGRKTAGQVIEHVMTHQPQDKLVRSRDLTFIADPACTNIAVITPEQCGTGATSAQNLHRNALTPGSADN